MTLVATYPFGPDCLFLLPSSTRPPSPTSSQRPPAVSPTSSGGAGATPP